MCLLKCRKGRVSGTSFGSQRVKWHKTLPKSAREHFYNNFPLISKRLSCVACLLVGYESLGLFSKILTTDHK